MASSQKTNKPASRWGFLSQAVASVESKLDTILAEDDAPQKKPPVPAPVKENVSPSRGSTETSRSSTTLPSNDRLQERLARAMAKKNTARTETSTPASEPVSRSATPNIADLPIPTQNDTENIAEQVEVDEPEYTVTPSERNSTSVRSSQEILSTLGIPTADAHKASSEVVVESVKPRLDRPALVLSEEEPDADLLKAQLYHEEEKAGLQEEINGYIERIDALNSKLQYLAKQAAQSAKDAANDADSNSIERKLSEKDERIALLLDEGRKLSITERRNLDIIKKLKSQAITVNKDQDASRRRTEQAERQVAILNDKVNRSESLARKAEEKYNLFSKTSQDLEAVTKERNALNQTLADMKGQVAKANARAEAAEIKAQSDKLDLERKRNTELEGQLTTVMAECKTSEDKLRREIKELQTVLNHEKEQSRTMESEMLAEQAALESKLESIRVRAEEASSNDQGDSQAKLLRQIETLQSQYSAASQNWQGIEGTLLARITSLENDRDEVAAREADVRRKLRDAVSKWRINEKELEEVNFKLSSAQDTQSNTQLETQRLTRKVQQLEEDLIRSQKELEDRKTKMERDFARRLDEEKTKWAASIQRVRTESPGPSVRKSSGYGMDFLASPTETRPHSRRSSTLVSNLAGLDASMSPRNQSASFARGSNGVIPETPSIVTSTAEPDEYFSGIPATPGSDRHPRHGFNDLVSTSTVGAGPSVQLVERMSANVRRLESEKAASKDELARLMTQRDESRQEVVRLMREVENKTKLEVRLKQLEQDHSSLAGRYQTTLELLGEKSEQVDELKQDIVDVKQMYRELADHMK